MRQTVSQLPEFTLLGEASNGATALTLAVELKPDLIIMDIHLQDMDGLEVTREILKALPATKIIIFSADLNREIVDKALESGACGYLWKGSAAEELVRAINMVLTGRLYLSPEVSVGILEDYRRALCEKTEPQKPLLSEREKQLLELIAKGRRNKEIAAVLQVSTKSVEAYRSRVMKKLQFSSSAELVRYAIREGIATP